MDNMAIWNAVKDTPAEAKKTITGGKLNGFTDINPMWRLRKLTELFGACGVGWKYEIDNMHCLDGANGEVMVFASVNLYIRDGEAWSAPIPGCGGSMLISTQKGSLVSNDDGYKMAISDAIGSACKALGMSEDVYMSGTGGSKYARPQEPAVPPANPAAAADVRLNFGKYSGKTIREIYNTDKQYLVWLGENKDTKQDLKNAVRMVLEAANASKQSRMDV